MYIYNGQKITFPIVIDEVRYQVPPDSDKLAEIGVTVVDDPVADERIYMIAGDGTITRRPNGMITPQIWEDIKAWRDARKSAGVLVDDKWFHSDSDSRIQQLGLVMMGASIPPGLQWKTMDGSFVTMTQALAMQIFAATAASDITIFAKAEVCKTAVLAAPEPETVDWRTGWPLTYEESIVPEPEPNP